MPAWVPFNWGSRGLHYKVGGVIVADFFWPKTVQVNVYGHDESNDELLNVFHVATPDAVTDSNVADIAATVRTWTLNFYRNVWAENISSDRVVATDVSTADSFQTELIANTSGGLIGAAVPSNVTLAVKKSTGRSGRSNRGDWYTWPCTVNQLEVLDSNLFLESHRDACLTNLNELLTDLLDAGFQMVVASEATGLTRAVQTFVCTDRAVDSQRRRLKGRGR